MRKINKSTMLILLLAVSNSAVYGVPYIKDTFYELMKNAMKLSHTQIGIASSMYGIVATFSYLLGGIVADFISAKKLLFTSLVGMGTLSVLLSMNPGYIWYVAIMAMMGIFSVLTFYPAAIKTLVFLGGEEHQGNAFGMFDFGISLANMAISLLSLAIVYIMHHHVESFFLVVRAYGIICLICAGIMGKAIRQWEAQKTEQTQINIKHYIECVRSENVWLMSGIVLCAYFITSSLSYINAYLSQVLEMNKDIIYLLAIIRLNVMVTILAPVIGKIVDHLGTSMPVVITSFIILILSFAGITLWYDVKKLSLLLIGLVLVSSAMSVTLKIIAYMPIQEMRINAEVQGFVIGFVSFIGYLPDSFYYGVMGNVLDRYPVGGFQIIFLGSVVMAIFGMVCGKILQRKLKN